MDRLISATSSSKRVTRLVSRILQGIFHTSSHPRPSHTFQPIHRNRNMPFDTYRSTTVSMEDRLLTAPLKIMLEGQQPDSCPLLLNQEQVARIPRKLYNVISRDGVPEDLGDMGTVVRLKGKQYNVPLIRALNWIVKGVAADFLTARKFDVLKREGDRKCNSTPHVAFATPCLLHLFHSVRKSHQIRPCCSRRRCSVHRGEHHPDVPCRRHRPVHLQY